MGSVTPDWIAQLAPPHAPPPPGWWPLAPGWWMLLLVFAVLAAAFTYWWRSPGVRLRRLALRELESIQTHISDDRALAQALENLLRRYAVARFGREQVAGLSGERWNAFVVEHGGAAWAGGTGAALLRTAYGGAATADRASWLAGAQAFIRWRK